MNKVNWILGIVGLVFFQNAAHADPSFDGVHVGAQLGYAIIDSTVQISRVRAPSASDTSDISGRGPIGGITLDWCRILGNSDMLLGGEISFNYATLKGVKSTKGTFIYSPATAFLETTVEFSRATDIALKVGYMSKGAALAYFKVGPSLSRWRSVSSSTVTNTKAITGKNNLGVILGIGAQFPITYRVSWAAEYNFRRYGNFGNNINCPAGVALRSVAINPSLHAVMLRLNYKLSATDFADTPPEKKEKTQKTP